ncbi:MAG TPA: tRNA pseudouridine(38-40) synthase TruA [Anaerolineae bacterium]|nr:tRNA pseudouridine(38-40) synthase TruA [Anaerolineae bacterium]HQH37550.1 tRNA pseudouridine(38-40) synthase TruA [Anaerolineae bacterium]
MRVKAVVAYDGTGYGGFQRQTNAPSIQEELERALEKLMGVPCRVLAAGRTDAGVHAAGQVIAFDTLWGHSLTDLQRGINALLPQQIAVWRLEIAEPTFHPRYEALRRWYRYTLYRGAVRNPLVGRFSLHIARSLNVEAMRLAAARLVGQQDFTAFGSPAAGGSAIREVYRAVWTEQDAWLYFDIEANAFLYRMVRLIVGTLLRVGEGVLSPEEFGDILRTRDRRQAGPAVSAQGLCLQQVYYAGETCTSACRLE